MTLYNVVGNTLDTTPNNDIPASVRRSDYRPEVMAILITFCILAGITMITVGGVYTKTDSSLKTECDIIVEGNASKTCYITNAQFNITKSIECTNTAPNKNIGGHYACYYVPKTGNIQWTPVTEPWFTGFLMAVGSATLIMGPVLLVMCMKK